MTRFWVFWPPTPLRWHFLCYEQWQKWDMKYYKMIWISCRSSFATDWRTKVSSFKILKEEALSFNQGWSHIEMRMNLCKIEFYFSFNRLDEISPFFVKVRIFHLYSSSFTEISRKIYFLQRHRDDVRPVLLSFHFVTKTQLNGSSHVCYTPLYYKRLRGSSHKIYAKRIYIFLTSHGAKMFEPKFVRTKRWNSLHIDTVGGKHVAGKNILRVYRHDQLFHDFSLRCVIKKVLNLINGHGHGGHQTRYRHRRTLIFMKLSNYLPCNESRCSAVEPKFGLGAVTSQKSH